MNKRVRKAVSELHAILKEELSEETVSFNLFVNSEGAQIEYSERTAESLIQDGISMKNIRGDFIRDSRSPSSPPTGEDVDNE